MDSRRVCSVLQCTETLSDGSSNPSNRSRTITSLTIYRTRVSGYGRSNGRSQKLASVTPLNPTLNQVSDGIKFSGQLSDQQASLSLELTKTNDCLDSQFSCLAISVDDQGRTSIKKALVGKAVRSSDYDSYTQATNILGLTQGSSETPNRGNSQAPLMQLANSVHMKVDLIGSRLEDSLKALENRLEDKVGDLRALINERTSGMDNSIEGRFGTLDTKMQTLENRLGDRMTQVHNFLLQNLRQIDNSGADNADVCDQLASKLDGLEDKLETNSGKLDTCVTAAKTQNESRAKLTDQLDAAIDQCIVKEDAKLNKLVAGVSNLSDVTQTLVSSVHSFRDSYRSGALVPVEEFSDPLGTGKKEWRLAFRGTAFNNVRVYPAYMYGTGIPADVEEGCKQFNRSLPCANHYRNRDALHNWAGVDEVLFAIYVDGQMVKKVIFNGKGSTFTNWFAVNRVISSSWSDLTAHSHNFFSIAGAEHIDHFRRFFMNLDYDRGCDGFRGWFKATETDKGCPVEITAAIPFFQYAAGNTFALWTSTAAVADAFGIYLRYE